MQELNFEYFVPKERQGEYIKIPFDVPENVEKMIITYRYSGDFLNSTPKEYEKNVIDFTLLDWLGRDAGGRGSDYYMAEVSASYSTPGFKKLEVNAGTWHIILGAYMVKPEGVTVKYNIKFYFKHIRLLKGDMHSHTTNSDGKLTIPKLAKTAKREGLDFIIISDHNNNLDGVPLASLNNFTVIPGVELTNYKGHINFVGSVRPYTRSFAANSFEEFKQIVAEAKNSGAFLSINHPLCSLCGWKFPFEGFHYDAVEVWNGPMRKDNLKNIAWWHNELLKGKRLVAVGGSDFHRKFYVIKTLGSPTTRVFSASYSAHDILEGIKKGNCVITYSPKSPLLIIKCGNALPGDAVEFKEGLTLEVSVDKLKRGHKLKVYNNDKIILECKKLIPRPFKRSVAVQEKGFIRAEIEYKKSLLGRLLHRLAMFFYIKPEAKEKVPPFIHALTNPIYFK